MALVQGEASGQISGMIRWPPTVTVANVDHSNGYVCEPDHTIGEMVRSDQIPPIAEAHQNPG